MASEGFICPECKESFIDSIVLSDHFEKIHTKQLPPNADNSITSLSEDLATNLPDTTIKQRASKTWGFINTIASKFENKDADKNTDKNNATNLEKKLEAMKKYAKRKNDEVLNLKQELERLRSKPEEQASASFLLEHLLLSEVLLFYNLNSHQNPELVDSLCSRFLDHHNGSLENSSKFETNLSLYDEASNCSLRAEETADILALTAEIDELRSKCQTLESELANSKAKNTKYSEVLKKTKAKSKENINKLTTEGEVLTQNLQKKTQQADELRAELKEKVLQIKSLEAEKKESTQTFKKDNGELIKKVENMKSEINSLKSEMESLTNLNTSNEAKVECLKASNEELTEKLKNLEAMKQDYQAEKEKWSIKLEHAKSKINRLELSSEKLKETIESLMDKLAKSENEYKNSVSACNTKIDSFRSKFELVSEENCSLTEKNTRLQKELSQSKEQYTTLCSELDEKKALIESLTENIRLCEEKYNKVNYEHRNVLDSIGSEKVRISQLERSCRDNGLVICEMTEKMRTFKEELMLVYNAKWLSDEDFTHCCDCNTEFTFFLRKHHCRWCGKIMCFECGDHFIPISRSGRPKRVCKPCKEKFDMYREY